MDGSKIKVFYFNNGTGGGVLSVIRNLLTYAQNDEIENHVIYTINKDLIKQFEIPNLTGAASAQVFYYSSKWNFYHTCKKLSRLIPDHTSVIVANDWLELGMVSTLGRHNPVIQILHGEYEYYYNVAVKHNEWINAFITVAEVMFDKLAKRLPERINDIHYLPFPVPDVSSKSFRLKNELLHIIFIGRPTKEKGYDLLPLLDCQLRGEGIVVKWYIVGEVPAAKKSIWSQEANIEFYGQLPNEQVVEVMLKMDCLVLPSLAEGMPVTLVEAMKVGLTCLVNDLPGGVQELIEDDVTGYKIKGNELLLYVKCLQLLNTDRSLLEKIGRKAREKACVHFEPVNNTRKYEDLIVRCVNLKRKRSSVSRIYGSRLDQRWIPNFVTNAIRSFNT